MSNNIRTRNELPFNFVDGLKIAGKTLHNTKYQFSGNGAQTEFVLPVTPADKDSIDVFVKQQYIHSVDYTLVDETITLINPPPALIGGETSNIEIKVMFII